ncbi:MAG: hypothetical protein K0U41_09355 [Gammaproteobacteria bacterium]|nr:hypothetical protein [Gammaproteobacteria bacterium]
MTNTTQIIRDHAVKMTNGSKVFYARGFGSSWCKDKFEATIVSQTEAVNLLAEVKKVWISKHPKAEFEAVKVF